MDAGIVTQRSGDLAALIAAHNLRELRVLAGQTQEQISANTGFKQTNVSRLEKRADMKLSTLRSRRLARRQIENRCRRRGQKG
jgi:transcriptional regulator